MRVLVVGAGLGGLTAGAALAQRDVDVDVVEQRSADLSLGIGLVLPANALRALREIGVLDECLCAGFQFDRNRFCDPDGRLLVEVPSLVGRRDGLPSVAVSRPDLRRVLMNAAEKAGAHLTFGTTVGAVACDGDGAHVSTSDGRTRSYDLVLGFDGIRSTLRRQVVDPSVGSAAAPRYTGFASWRVTVPRAPEITQGTLFMGVGSKVGLNPLSHGSMYLFATSREPADAQLDAGRLHEFLRERLAGYGGLVREVLDSLTASDSIAYTRIEEVRLPPPWHRDRVLLAGDAAHATAPHLTQGAAMAVEDAVVVARLVASGDPLPTLLTAFCDRRYERCAFVQDTSRRILLAEMATDEAALASRADRIRALPGRMAEIDAVLSRPAW
jgi:2-polyprenyl-6-methoxyphenol hydroxylase-like FAD-dependent oxidoreductase